MIVGLDEVRPGSYDFIDLGAGRGDSLRFYQTRTGLRGLGVELSVAKVEEALAAELDVVRADLFDLPRRPLVRFVTADNVLEHLPSVAAVEAALALVRVVATEFVVIRHPSFEAVDYLRSLDVRPYWANWHGHRSPVLIRQFEEMFHKLGFASWEIHQVCRIAGSDDPVIVPTTAARDEKLYDAERHGPKPAVRFAEPVYFAVDILAHVTAEPRVHLRYEDDPETSRKRPTLVFS